MNDVKRFDAIDLVKFIAAILIVALHSDLFINNNQLIYRLFTTGITRMCVPFFFVVSAFFYFRKPISWNYTKNYCKRLLILYASWFIISLPKTVFDRIISSEYSIGVTVFRFFRSFFVTSTFSGSWFIISCIFCALLYFLISKLNKNIALIITIIISVIVYLWIVFTSAYGKLIVTLGIESFYNKYEMLFGNPYVSFLVGIPYFGLGKFFADQYTKNEMSIFNKRTCISGACLVFLLFIFEILFCYKNNLCKSTDCYLMLFPFILFAFPLIVNWKIELKNAKYLRISSTVIFFSQFLILFTFEVIENVLSIFVDYIFRFLITVSLGIIATWIILKLQNRKGFHWLKYLY